jgi:hypothetical protein
MRLLGLSHSGRMEQDWHVALEPLIMLGGVGMLARFKISYCHQNIWRTTRQRRKFLLVKGIQCVFSPLVAIPADRAFHL